MINYQEEIKRFKPSLDVDNIEERLVGVDLKDMTDLMVQLISRNIGKPSASPAPRQPKNSDEL